MTMPEDPWALPTWAGDLDEIIDAALVQLRMDPSDADAARLQHHAATAVRRIDKFLDPGTGPTYSFPPPPELFEAAVNVTVRLFKAKDAPFGVMGGYSDFDTGPITVPADPLLGVYPLIRPLKLSFGVA